MDKPEFAERQAEILVIIHFIDGSERWIRAFKDFLTCGFASVIGSGCHRGFSNGYMPDLQKKPSISLKKREKFRTLAAVSGIEFRANQKNKNV